MAERQDRNDALVQQALDGLQAAAASHSAQRTHDPAVRAAYSTLIRSINRRIWKQDQAGKLCAEHAAIAATDARSDIPDVTRVVSRPAGRKAAVAMKSTGRSLDSWLEKYAQRFHQKPFDALDDVERTDTLVAVIQASGRSNIAVNPELRALGASARLFWALTALMAAWDISHARDKVLAAGHDLAVPGGSVVAGEVFAARSDRSAGRPGRPSSSPDGARRTVRSAL